MKKHSRKSFIGKSLLFACSVCAMTAALGCSSAAQAQSINYGSWEELFGEPITTSATGTPQRASDVAANMTIITADEIRQSGSREIPQILGIYVPGLDILQTSSTTFDVGVRGYQQPFQPRLLVLVDGRQVFIDDYSRTIWDNIPVNVDDIRQIEVVKGASSALFGSNAAGGVINIITYSPIYDNDNVASLTYGTQNTLSGDATATAKMGDWGGVKISAGGMNADEFDTSRSAADSSLDMNPSHRYVTESSVVRLAPDLQAHTEITYSENHDIGAGLLNTLDSQEATTYSFRGGLAWQTPYGLITNDNYFNHAHMELEFPGFGSTSINTTDIIVSRLQDQFKFGADHTFQVAFEYRHKEFGMDYAISEPLAQTPVTAEDGYAVNGTWLWQINDKWSWTNAARLDHQDQAQTGTLAPNPFVTNADYSHSLNAFSANSGLVYKATDLDTFRLTYGRGVQIPSLVQVGFIGSASAGPLVIVNEGNPDLKPTVVTDYELGYDRKFPALFSTTKASVFYEMNQDTTAINPNWAMRMVGTTPYELIQDVNVGNSQGWGGELELKGAHPSGFRWDASWSYSRVYDAPLVLTTLDYENSSPRNHFKLSGGYTTGPWEFDLNGQYVTSTDMMGEGLLAKTPVDGYASLGGRISYNINDRFVVAVSGTNVNNDTIKENPYPAIERQVFLTLTGRF